MDRRRFLLTSLAGALVGPPDGEAQQAGKTVGVVWPFARSAARGEQAFRQGLADQGYIEGRNIAVLHRWADGRADLLTSLFRDLVVRKVDAIVTSGTAAVRAARDVTDTVPIIMAGAGDPVGTRLIQSLAKPGGNITGLSHAGEELLTKGLSLLKEAAPRVRRVGILMNAANPANTFLFDRMQGSAGLQAQRADIRGSDDFEPVVGALQVDAVFVLADPLFGTHAKQIVDLVLRRHLPVAGADPILPRNGGLISYSPDFVDLWRRSAAFVVRVLHGAAPGGLPVEQPTKFELVINLKTAKTLGLTIPPSLLARADQVIE